MMTEKPTFFQRARKFVVAALGLAASAAAAGLLDDTTEAVVMAVIAVATALGVYQTPNAPDPSRAVR